MRSDPQNKCFHKWCRVIATHVSKDPKTNVTEKTVKQLVLREFGNTKIVELPGFPAQIAVMGSSDMKMSEKELTYWDLKSGFIAMDELLGRMEAWAATDLNLILMREDLDAERIVA